MALRNNTDTLLRHGRGPPRLTASSTPMKLLHLNFMYTDYQLPIVRSYFVVRYLDINISIVVIIVFIGFHPTPLARPFLLSFSHYLLYRRKRPRPNPLDPPTEYNAKPSPQLRRGASALRAKKPPRVARLQYQKR